MTWQKLIDKQEKEKAAFGEVWQARNLQDQRSQGAKHLFDLHDQVDQQVQCQLAYPGKY